jgi:hypothetical protein
MAQSCDQPALSASKSTSRKGLYKTVRGTLGFEEAGQPLAGQFLCRAEPTEVATNDRSDLTALHAALTIKIQVFGVETTASDR